MSEQRFFNHRERIALYLAEDGRCAQCGTELKPGWHADHITAWSHGGDTDVVNGQALCPTCNLKKGDKTQLDNKNPLRNWQREALELYDQHQGKTFLVEACPAAGKTRFMAEVVFREHAKGKADAFVIVVPSEALRYQMSKDFHDETGIQLNPEWNGMTPLLHGRYKGVVVTYAWVAYPGHALLLRKAISRQNTLITLDEVHHASEEDGAWGKSAHESFDQASRILLTTGTPFRGDGNAIPWVNYDKEGKALPNYSYNYGRAVVDGVVRQITFNHHEGTMEWMNEDGKQKATFADKVNKRGESERLRTALYADGEHVGALMERGFKKIYELQKEDPDAAVLFITMNQEHAGDVATRIRKEHGVNSIVPISSDPASADMIKSFKDSQATCIVAVRMVSEGVNIPRIRVIVYLTNIVSELFFMQAMGRAMRIEPDHDDPTAWVYIPDDERLRTFAQSMMDASDKALTTREKRTNKEDNGEDKQPSLFYDPISSTSEQIRATVGDKNISPFELSYAATMLASNQKALVGFTPRR